MKTLYIQEFIYTSVIGIILTPSVDASLKQDISHEVFNKPWSEFVGSAMLAERKLGIKVNFDPEMLEIIAEAELLETLGFVLPNIILTVTTQKERIHAKLDALNKMVKEYTFLINSLDKPQVINN